MRTLAVLVVAASALLGACAAPVASSVIDVELTEFAITTSNDRATAGDLTLDIWNTGEFPHTIVVSDTAGRVVRATDLIPPGANMELELDLPEGRYQFTCRIVAEADDGTLYDHFEQGMRTSVMSVG